MNANHTFKTPNPIRPLTQQSNDNRTNSSRNLFSTENNKPTIKRTNSCMHLFAAHELQNENFEPLAKKRQTITPSSTEMANSTPTIKVEPELQYEETSSQLNVLSDSTATDNYSQTKIKVEPEHTNLPQPEESQITSSQQINVKEDSPINPPVEIAYRALGLKRMLDYMKELDTPCLNLKITPPTEGERKQPSHFDNQHQKALELIELLNILSDNTKITSIELDLSGSFFNNEALHMIADALPVNLTKLNLSKCSLTSFPDGFRKLSRLTELNLYHNLLTELPSDALTSLTSLTTLNLKMNELMVIPTDGLNSSTLTNLNLAQNQIHTLEFNAFRLMPNLTTVNLTNNKCNDYGSHMEHLNNIPSSIFAGTRLYERYRDEETIDVSKQILSI